MIQQNLKRMGELSTYYFLNNVFRNILSFLFVPIYTSYLTPADYGIIGILAVSRSWLEKFISAPIGNGITRFYHNPEIKDHKGSVIFTAYCFCLIQILIPVIVILFFNKKISGIILGDEKLFNLVKIYSFVLFLHPFSTLFRSLLRIKGKAKYILLVSITSMILTSVSQIIMLVVFKLGIKSMIFGSILVATTDIILFSPIILKEMTFKINWKHFRALLVYGYPIMISATILTSLNFFERYFLRISFGLNILGIYTFGNKMASVMGFIFTPLKQAFLPIVFKMEENRNSQEAFLKKSLVYIYSLSIFIWLIFSIFAKEAVEFLARNKDFWKAWEVVPILGFFHLQVFLSLYVSNTIVMAKNSILLAFTSICKLIFSVILLILLVPYLGIVGAALAILSGQIVLNIMRTLISMRMYNQDINYCFLIFLSLYAFIFYCLIRYINNLSMHFFLAILLKLIIAISSYMVILIVFRVITKKRIQIIFNLIRKKVSKSKVKI